MSPLFELIVLLLTPSIPLLLAGALALRPADRRLIQLGAWAALPGLLTSAVMAPGIGATVPWVLQGSEFGLDELGRGFLFFSAAIWLAGGLFARSWIVPARQGRFFRIFLLVMSGNLGLIVARDMLAFYLFFTLMSIGAYALVVHERNQVARHAGRIYMAFVMAGDVIILVAMLFLARDTQGSLLFEVARDVLATSPERDLISALLILGFGVKVGLLGLHVTLPLIYRAAPLPAATVLAGAMINAGLLGWLRFLPAGNGGSGPWAALLMAAGLAAAFYGVAMGLPQRNAKTVLAYSSISQLGIVTVGVGVAVAAPAEHTQATLMVVALYALHHAFAKTALFLGTGIAVRAAAPPLITALGLTLPALALTGAPLTTGMLAKDALKESLAWAPPDWAHWAKLLLPWTACATTLIVARFLWLVWPLGRLLRGPPTREQPRTMPGADRYRLLAAWAFIVLLSLSAAWLVPLAPHPPLWQISTLWAATWPVLLGAVVAVAMPIAQRRFQWARTPAPPAGDLIVPMQALSRGVIRLWLAVARRLLPAFNRHLVATLRHIARHPRWPALLARAETDLGRWPFAVTLFAALVLAMVGMVSLI